jgi:hypothetical protein
MTDDHKFGLEPEPMSAGEWAIIALATCGGVTLAVLVAWGLFQFFSWVMS